MKKGIHQSASPFFIASSDRLAHKRVAVVRGRNQGFFDGSRGYPTQQIEYGTGFVVGARAACAAKRLLAHHGACGFVIDVEVSCRKGQCLGGFIHRVAVRRKDGAR